MFLYFHTSKEFQSLGTRIVDKLCIACLALATLTKFVYFSLQLPCIHVNKSGMIFLVTQRRLYPLVCSEENSGPFL